MGRAHGVGGAVGAVLAHNRVRKPGPGRAARRSAIMIAMQQRTFVHVVEVSPEGQVMNVRAADGRWSPSQAQIAYHLGRFVRLVRSLPTDGVVLRENWLEAYRFLTPQAAAQLSEIARQDDPFLSLGRVGRTVHIRSIIARSDNAWEVSWVERATNATGTSDGEALHRRLHRHHAGAAHRRSDRQQPAGLA
jgi:type IV secretory pathway TrbF-like protein